MTPIWTISLEHCGGEAATSLAEYRSTVILFKTLPPLAPLAAGRVKLTVV